VKGHLRQRSLGRWAVVLDHRDPETGNRKRRWHSFTGTKREAQMEVARLIAERQSGLSIDPSRETVAAFLDRWIEHMKGQVAPKSLERYTELARKSLAPLLGGLVLTKLQPAHISQAYAKALTSGRRNGGGALSPRTVTHMHRILRQALQQAVRWQLLARNPADAVRPPKVERGAMTTYDLAQTAELIEALRGNRLLVPVILAVLCGLRRGEIAALKWRSVSLESGQLAVVASAEQTKAGVRYKPPKSGRSRTLALPATVAAELRAHQLNQAEELLRLGIRQTDDGFIVAQADGTPLRPHSLGQEWVRFLARTPALPRIRFHDLRHAHATHMLANGVHPKVASERLGHSKIGITLDLYSHVIPGMQEDAAARVDDALQAALRKRQAERIG
jgi:integrase